MTDYRQSADLVRALVTARLADSSDSLTLLLSELGDPPDWKSIAERFAHALAASVILNTQLVRALASEAELDAGTYWERLQVEARTRGVELP